MFTCNGVFLHCGSDTFTQVKGLISSSTIYGQLLTIYYSAYKLQSGQTLPKVTLP